MGDRFSSVRRGGTGIVAVLVAAMAMGTALAGDVEQKLVASDGAAGDEFGAAVAIDVDTTVIGAPGESLDRGAAYVHVRYGGLLVEQAKLVASDGAASDLFGGSVSLSGDTAVVGSSGDESSRGAAYVFTRSAGVWIQHQKLTASDGTAGDGFGLSVCITGDSLVVGASGDDGARGAAYVFTRSGTTWSEQRKLTASDAAADDEFGCSVSLDGDTAVVGAWRDDDRGTSSGAAYVFVRSGGDWSEQQKLLPSGSWLSSGYFGYSIAVGEDTVVVGASGDASTAAEAGSAYVFVRSVGVWTLQQRLMASDFRYGDRFGYSVALRGDTTVIGASVRGGDYSLAPGGAAYEFVRSGSTWTQQRKLTAPDAAEYDHFGSSVALSGDAAVIGAVGDDDQGAGSGSAYTHAYRHPVKIMAPDAAPDDEFGLDVALLGEFAIIGCPGDDDHGSASGAAYVYTRESGAWVSEARLSELDASAGDAFGRSVDIDGSTLVVGVPGDVASETAQGAVRVYVLEVSGAWTEQASLVAPETSSFGGSVAVSGDTAVVGAMSDNPTARNRGGAHVFERDQDGTWSQGVQLLESDIGASVAIDGDTILVGAYGGAGGYVGSTFVFVREPSGAWTQQAELVAGDGASDDAGGWSVAIDGDTAVIGAPGEDGWSYDAGAAYVFTRDGSGVWTEAQKLVALSPGGSDWYGFSVAVMGDTALVGCPHDDRVETWNLIPGFGWSRSAALLPPPETTGHYGQSVALSGSALIGAPWDNGEQLGTGAVHAFARVGRAPDLQVLPVVMPPATAGTDYAGRFRSIGGVRAHAWDVSSGGLPVPGGLDADTGAFSGSLGAPGTHTFTIRVRDAFGSEATRAFEMTVNARPVIVTTTLPFAVNGRPYGVPIDVSGGTGSIAWTLTRGALPTGIALDAHTGELTGVPDVVGRSSFTVRGRDSDGAESEQDLLLDVVPVVGLMDKKHREDVHYRPADEILPICRALELVAGTRLDVTVKLPEKDAEFELEILDGAQQPLDLSDHLKRKRKSLQLKRFVVSETSRYLVLLRQQAPTDGVAKILLKVKPPTRMTGELTLDGQQSHSIQLGTLPGARVNVVVKAAKKSSAVPDVLSMKDSAGNELIAPGDIRRKAKKVVLRMNEPAPGGTLTVTVATRDGAAGDVKWTASIKEPKGYVYSDPDLPVGDRP